MFPVLAVFAALLTSASVYACGDHAAHAGKDKVSHSSAATKNAKPMVAKPQGEVANFTITDHHKMMCSSCEEKIESSLKKTDGVYAVVINRKDNRIAVDFDKAKTNTESLTAAIQSAGFKAAVAN